MKVTDNIDQVAGDINKFVDDLQTEAENMLGETVENIRARMSVEGDPITYPVNWDNERQRRFVMAKLRKEGNLPYKRTGQYALGWKANRIPFGHSLSNAHPAGAVGGTPSGWQSRIHRGRWPYLLNVLFDELAKIPAKLSNLIKVTESRD